MGDSIPSRSPEAELRREIERQRLSDELRQISETNIHPSAFASYEDCLKRRAELEIRRRQILDKLCEF